MTQPLISCIMPTYDRRAFVPRAIDYFLRQSYEPKELIVIDDGTDQIGDLIPADPRIRYFGLNKKLNLGAKLNLACEYAHGDIIANWDDDDWYAPHRLNSQVQALLTGNADVCGLSHLLYYDLRTGRAYKYIYPTGRGAWLGTLCYFKVFWANHRFADIQVGMDGKFVQSAGTRRAVALADCTFAVHIIHDNNVSPKHLQGVYWHDFPVEEIRHLLGTDWSLYEANPKEKGSQMIISFSKLGNHGRLGNQLFQIASTMGLAEKHGGRAVFPNWAYEPYFETPIPHGPMQNHRLNEKYFHHHEWEIKANSDLLGYLQSEKYFGSTRLKLRETFIREAKAKMPGLFERQVICIQIRRGDYVGNEAYHQLTPNYFIDALLTHFPDWRSYNILFISDDIEYCRTHFECMPNAFFSKNQDIVDLALASACDHFIISNSAFGWWGAWLGGKPHSKIICCGLLHQGSLAHLDSKDYYPDRWIRHQKDNCKISLRDVTFTVPIFMDHSDRKKNLDLSLCILQKSFDANFIVCEQGGNQFQYMSQWAQYIQEESPIFHRTKMLNDMAMMAETPFIANWDCDVIIPPMQVYLAVEELRNGVDVVYPFDGRFARMDRGQWFPRIEKFLDIGIVGATPFKGRVHGQNSVGGAVMFNKESFVQGGMENEYMISYGPEDCERHDRFKKLGFNIKYIRGTLFHMNHYIGVNSSGRNPYFQQNHKELTKIREMPKEDLATYINSWPWRHPYTDSYYREISEGAIRSAAVVMEVLGFKSGSVIDVGGGLGEWNNGNPDYWCIDYRVKPERLLIPADHFIECNLNQNIIHPTRKYDLCLCLEVGEHLNPDRAEALVEMLCSLSDHILFSAAIPKQGGVHHINEQWQSW
jgi:glycosyltransferase involved in cell wall biosynthesis